MPEDTVVPYSYEESAPDRPELSAEPIDKRPLIIGALVALGFFLLAIAIGVWLILNPQRAEVIRDIFIIYVGVGIFVLIPLLIVLIVIATYLILKVNDIANLLEREIKPMLSNMQTTINTIRGTSIFLSDEAVKPIINTSAYVAQVRAIVRALFRG